MPFIINDSQSCPNVAVSPAYSKIKVCRHRELWRELIIDAVYDRSALFIRISNINGAGNSIVCQNVDRLPTYISSFVDIIGSVAANIVRARMINCSV